MRGPSVQKTIATRSCADFSTDGARDRPLRFARGSRPESPRGGLGDRFTSRVASAIVIGLGLATSFWGAEPARAGDTGPPVIAGRIIDADGVGVVGVMLTLSHGDPGHRVSVFSNAAGNYRFPAVELASDPSLRARRIGWRDASRDLTAAALSAGTAVDFALERETDPAAIAEQLPANRWYALAVGALEDPAERAEFKRECTGCHQQGSPATRRLRDPEEWRKLIALMGRRGAMLTQSLRDKLPQTLNAAYDPAVAVFALLGDRAGADIEPPPEVVRRALIEEWDLGTRASTQHDILVHPDGRIYSVDGPQDMIHRLDPRVRGGDRKSWKIPDDGIPLGGIFARPNAPRTSTSNSHLGPHSLQTAPDGAIWVTLAIGNRLARFDPGSESWEFHDLPGGFYPHTLRFDGRGRIWYTLSASNHVGMFDPGSGEHRTLRLPAGSWQQEVTLRFMPFLMWLGRHVDLRAAASREGDGFTMPVPYGIDIAPDGGVWFSQLNEDHIGRVDPDSFAIEMIPTPFPTPRRLRFDSKGALWIPSFSANLISRFDPDTRSFESWPLPGPASIGRTPYALAVAPDDKVWICGTNSDSLIRFDPDRQEFTVYPLPTRVTYSREIDFDSQGRVWTSNSNSPSWQIEGGVARVVRLTPDRRRHASEPVAGTPHRIDAIELR